MEQREFIILKIRQKNLALLLISYAVKLCIVTMLKYFPKYITGNICPDSIELILLDLSLYFSLFCLPTTRLLHTNKECSLKFPPPPSILQLFSTAEKHSDQQFGLYFSSWQR